MSFRCATATTARIELLMARLSDRNGDEGQLDLAAICLRIAV
jgi:hypothetical protein